MRNRILLGSLALFIALPSGLFGQINTQLQLFPVYLGDKCGYIDKSGVLRIRAEFDTCDEFSDGYAGVSVAKKGSYVDPSGKPLTSVRFEGAFPEPFSEGLATVRVLDKAGRVKVGYIDRLGSVRILPHVDEAYSFHDGRALVRIKGKWGYLDKSLSVVIPATFELARSFSNGLASVSDAAGQRDYYIDKVGRIVIANYGTDGSDFSEDLARFRNESGSYGYMDTAGNIVVKPRFSFPCLFYSGLACAEQGGKWGYIDRTGAFVIPPTFEEAGDFSTDGFAMVKSSGQYGLIDKRGNIVLPAIYDSLIWNDGLALVTVAGVKSLVDLTGKTVWKQI